MNNRQKNNLEFSDPQFETFSDNTVLDELQEKINNNKRRTNVRKTLDSTLFL